MKTVWAGDPPSAVGWLYGALMRWLNARTNAALLAAAGIERGQRVVEIGCGPGQLVGWLHEAVGPEGSVVGVDPSPSLRQMAICSNARAIAAGRVAVVDGTAEVLPCSEGSADVVLSAHAFQFWPDPHAAFREIYRVLRPGGRLALALRLHGASWRDRLPNPLAGTEDEVGEARAAAERAGFACELQRGALLLMRREGR